MQYAVALGDPLFTCDDLLLPAFIVLADQEQTAPGVT
jgi:hypothetical protein